MKKLYLAFLLVLIVVGRVEALGSVGVDETLGSSGYRGTKGRASLDIGEDAYVTPSFSTYRTDTSSGSANSFGLRLGYEAGPFSFGVQGGFQPKHTGYKQSSFGADATFTLTPGGSKHGHKMAGPSSEGTQTFGAGLAAVDVGAAVNIINHSDDFQAPALTTTGSGPGPSRRQIAARAGAFNVSQRDFSVFAGAKFLIVEASAEVTKSSYNKNLDANNAREAEVLNLPSVSSTVQGFPDTSLNARLKWKTFPLVRPYVTYTHTTFKLGQSPSNAYEAGATLGLDLFSVKAAYERYVQAGFTSQNYYTLGASLNF